MSESEGKYQIFKLGCSTKSDCNGKINLYDTMKRLRRIMQGWGVFGDFSFAAHPVPELKQVLPDYSCDWNDLAFRKYIKDMNDKTLAAYGLDGDFNMNTDWQAKANFLNCFFSYMKAGDFIIAFEGNTPKGVTRFGEDICYEYLGCNQDIKLQLTQHCYGNTWFPCVWVDWKLFMETNGRDDLAEFKQGGQGVKAIEACGLPELIDLDWPQMWQKYKEDHPREFEVPPEVKMYHEYLKATRKERSVASLKRILEGKHPYTNCAPEPKFELG